MGIFDSTELDALLAHPAAAAASAQPSGIVVRLSGLQKTYGERRVLQALDLDIRAGEFVAVIGRSGCGKSTLLRLLAGLESPSAGQLALDGRTLEATHRELRFMFQDARLLPWKTVIGNVALGLPGKRAEVRAAAQAALAAVGLADRGDEWPARLSGGQRQRVALARALVHKPRLLLLDEPLGALDALTRIEMHALIERLWCEQGFTAVLVTHDVSEAIALADRVLLIDDGRVAHEVRSPLARPRTRGSAQFAALENELLQRVLQAETVATTATASAALHPQRAPAAPSTRTRPPRRFLSEQPS